MRIFDWYDAALIVVALIAITVSVLNSARRGHPAGEAMIISAFLMFAIIYRIIASWV
jgi:hypothetical protein